MLEVFKRHFLPDSVKLSTTFGSEVALSPDIARLIFEFGGISFNGGLYRVSRVIDLDLWASRIGRAFPEFKGRVTCFGYDWLGRAFATDTSRIEGGRPGVVMFEPGTGQALKIPANVETFHDNELINFGESALAIDFYDRWRRVTPSILDYQQCAGYKRPLFLGGLDNLENLEVSDIDVYWHVLGQLIIKSKDLPIGTSVRTIIG